MESKKPWKSKTILTGIILALLPLIPGVDSWVKAQPELFAQIIAGVFIALRLLSKGKIEIS